MDISADWLADEIGDMEPPICQTTDPKIIAAIKLLEAMPDYGKDAAVEDIAKVAKLINRTQQGGNGTDG